MVVFFILTAALVSVGIARWAVLVCKNRRSERRRGRDRSRDRELDFYRVLTEKADPGFLGAEEDFFQTLASGVNEIFSAQGAGVYMFADSSGDILSLKGAWGSFSALLDTPCELSLRGTLFESVIRKGAAFFLKDAGGDARLPQAVRDAEPSPGPMAVLPLSSGGRTLGMLVLLRGKNSPPFSREEEKRLGNVACFSARVLHNLELFLHALERKGIDAIHEASRDLQDRLCLRKYPSLPGAGAAGFRNSLVGIHSDYLDVLPLRDGRYLLVHGEVTGKSLSAAVTTVILRTILHLPPGGYSSVPATLAWLNRGLGRKLDMDLFAALAVLCFDPSSRRVSYGGAGHPGLLLFRHRELRVEELRTPGGPLGIDRKGRYESMDIPVESGDILVLHSDGVVEAMDGRGSIYGRKRLVRLIEENYFLTPRDLSEKIRKDLEQFRETRPQQDDESVLLLKIQ